MPAQPLTDDEVDQFVRHGFVVVKACFDPVSAREWIDRAWVRFGVDRDAPDQWVEKRIQLATVETVDAHDVAPKAWGAAVQLLGGEDRVDLPWRWGDGFIANLGVGDDRPWQPPSAEVTGWHKDGDFFRHFLDSPEQGLLTIVLWTDMHHRGGGTFIAADSVPVVAQHLAEHPEGLLSTEFDFQALAGRCTDFRELTGEAGDVVLMHPFMLHATSQNVIRHGRLITNPPVTLREPLQLDRDDPGALSPVERGVLHGLGVERYDVRRTGQRELVVPQRVLDQRAREAAEAERLAAAKLAAAPRTREG